MAVRYELLDISTEKQIAKLAEVQKKQKFRFDSFRGVQPEGRRQTPKISGIRHAFLYARLINREEDGVKGILSLLAISIYLSFLPRESLVLKYLEYSVFFGLSIAAIVLAYFALNQMF